MKNNKIKSILIVANGERPRKRLFAKLYAACQLRVCADGGLLHFLKNGLFPDVIIGDFDSLTESELHPFRDRCKIIQVNRQSDTDLEKALKYISRFKPAEVIITAAAGKRFDHMFANISLLIRYSAMYNIKMFTNHSVIIPVSGVYTSPCLPGEVISIFGIDSKTKITTNGLRYGLRRQPLPLGIRESISNVTTADCFSISVNGGTALLVREIKSIITVL